MLQTFKNLSAQQREEIQQLLDISSSENALVNIDYCDVKNLFGGLDHIELISAEATGENATQSVIAQLPEYLNYHSILVFIQGGDDLTVDRIEEVMEAFDDKLPEDAMIIFSAILNKNKEQYLKVSLIVGR